MALTKQIIVESVSETLDLKPAKAKNVIEELLEIMKSTLASEEDVMISGFGKFQVNKKSPRKGRNPATGKEMILDERRVVVFKCSGTLKNRINKGRFSLMTSISVEEWENRLDNQFKNNPLNHICYSQAVWSVLSVMEDKYLRFSQIDNLPEEQLRAHVDVNLNALTHPLRTLYKKNKQAPQKVTKDVIDEHYGWAMDWLDNAIMYSQFCSIHSLWHKKKISLHVDKQKLDTDGWQNIPVEYEVYNRLREKEGIGRTKKLNPAEILKELKPHVTVNEHRFKLNLNPKLVNKLNKRYSAVLHERYSLPPEWSSNCFTFEQFKKIFTTIQAILYARFVVRSALAMNGLEGCGYSDAVWVVTMSELKNRLSRYTKIEPEIVRKILKYITFGEVGIRDPDVALQPVLDLKNGFYALPPFVFLNTNVERNLCVLLNHIESERINYSKLTIQKEDILRDKLIRELKTLGYETTKGKLPDTDVDLAIIDRKNKTCISFELKWFIEPAEIRENVQRSEGLQKGVSQAEIIMNKFKNNDTQLIKDILNIDKTYSFSVAVGSMNWIGYFDVQSPRVPIIKIYHFIEKLKQEKSLKAAVDWLNKRLYLPKKSVDFQVEDLPLKIEDLRSCWYGIRLLD